MVLVEKRFTRRYFPWAVLAAMVAALSFASGCAGSRASQTSAVDRQYQQTLELQQRKAEAFQEKDLEAMLPPADDPSVCEQRGDIYLKQGNLAMAFMEYNRALKTDPNRMSTRQRLAYLMLKRGMWAGALSEFDTILKRSPANTVALHGKGTALMHLNRLKDAEEALTAAIGYNPNLWQTQALLGVLYDRQKLPRPAIEAYRKAIAINPKATAVYNNLGVSLLMDGEYRQASDAFLKAINLNASSPRTYNNLALALFKMGLLPEALEAFKKAGDEASAYNNMGVLCLEAQDYPRSVEFFEKAIELKPSYYESAYAGLEKARTALQSQQEKPGRVRDMVRSQ